MTVIESIIKNLETLPASKLVEVAHFISGLNPNRRNERIAALKARPEVCQARKARLSRKPCERKPIGLMPTPGNSLLLDTSVVVKHFRYPTAVVNKLAEYEELYLPQPALGELYYGAYRSGRLERSLAQIERFLDAVDLLAADKETSVFYGQIAAGLARAGTPIPQNDIWIAALARQTGLPVATTDDHFDRVTNLAVLKW